MRVTVDPDLCQGHGVCESEAPDVFSVPKGGPATVVVAEPGPDLLDGVRLAARYCPTTAITLEED
jgi:ferredoxin